MISANEDDAASEQPDIQPDGSTQAKPTKEEAQWRLIYRDEYGNKASNSFTDEDGAFEAASRLHNARPDCIVGICAPGSDNPANVSKTDMEALYRFNS